MLSESLEAVPSDLNLSSMGQAGRPHSPFPLQDTHSEGISEYIGGRLH